MSANGKELLLEIEELTDGEIKEFNKFATKQADLAKEYEAQKKAFKIEEAKSLLISNGYVIKTVDEFNGMINRLANLEP